MSTGKGFEYSEKEQAIFDFFGVGDIAKYIDAKTIYNMAAEQAFIQNDQSVFAESLRECMKAWKKHKIYRLTPEWESLIDDRCVKWMGQKK